VSGKIGLGPNTGALGAVLQVPFAHAEFMKIVEEHINRPTMRGLQANGTGNRGFLCLGLMHVAGRPYALEYNCRMGRANQRLGQPLYLPVTDESHE
jgi:phosphoribosylamine--glycine ligase